MSRPLRVTSTLLSTLVLSVVVALPAAATEAETSGGFGSGQWDGLILAGISGIVLGIVAFATSEPGTIPRAEANH